MWECGLKLNTVKPNVMSRMLENVDDMGNALGKCKLYKSRQRSILHFKMMHKYNFKELQLNHISYNKN